MCVYVFDINVSSTCTTYTLKHHGFRLNGPYASNALYGGTFLREIHASPT